MSEFKLFRVEVDCGLIEGVIDTEDLSVKAITAYQRQFYSDYDHYDQSLPIETDEICPERSRRVFALDLYNSLEEVNQSEEAGSDFIRAAINQIGQLGRSIQLCR